jgi:carotenoid cleavage dioxygenase-like enzyme
MCVHVCVFECLSGPVRRGDGSRRKPCRFGVMDRYTEDASGIKWMETDACYNYHVMNAWDHPEHPHRVVLVTCRSAMTGALGMADIRTPQFDGDQNHGVLKECVEEATLHRFVLDIEVSPTINGMASLNPQPSSVRWFCTS